MQHPGFFEKAGPFALYEVAVFIGATLDGSADASRQITNVCSLDAAGASDVTFIENKKYLSALDATEAGACIVAPAYAERVPAGTVALVMDKPYVGFAEALWLFYPHAGFPLVAGAQTSAVSRVTGEVGVVNAGAEGIIHATAKIEDEVVVEPGSVVCAEAKIGRGSRISSGAVIGYRCCVGRGSFVGPGASVTHALLGDRVIVHAGVRIGQDGFGFAMGSKGHRKVPQVGRVIIQDDVEIGANSCIDRGALKDTVIGEGTKIDNLVQIGHNAVIGRHCVIVGQVGIAGSAELGDFVVMGGQSGVVGHVHVGAGAQIAGGSHAKDDVPPHARMVGTPALPIREWVRQQAAMKRLADEGSGSS